MKIYFYVLKFLQINLHEIINFSLKYKISLWMLLENLFFYKKKFFSKRLDSTCDRKIDKILNSLYFWCLEFDGNNIENSKFRNIVFIKVLISM